MQLPKIVYEDVLEFVKKATPPIPTVKDASLAEFFKTRRANPAAFPSFPNVLEFFNDFRKFQKFDFENCNGNAILQEISSCQIL